MKPIGKCQTEGELMTLFRSLLDAPTIAVYGERDAMLMCASALGISTSSAIHFDREGRVMSQLPPEEVQRRIDFVRRMKSTKKMSFAKAIHNYFLENPAPDPLAELEDMLAKQIKGPRKTFQMKK